MFFMFFLLNKMKIFIIYEKTMKFMFLIRITWNFDHNLMFAVRHNLQWKGIFHEFPSMKYTKVLN